MTNVIIKFSRFTFIIKDYLRLLLNWAFGSGCCIVCGKETVYGDICKKCRQELLLKAKETSSLERCSVCGKILLSENNICMDCRKERIIFSCDKVFSIFPYRVWAKNLMFQWKMLERRGLSPFIAMLCSNAIKTQFGTECHFIVPVPPRNGKIRKKGWDQIDELCRYLETNYGYKILKLLKRKGNIQQKKLARKERLENSAEKYSLSEKALKLKRENLPQRVILIDDVMTTGITVESCAKALKSLGIKKVDALTVFIVD